MGLLLITRFTLQEAIRRRLFLAVVILSALFIGAFAILLNVAAQLVYANPNDPNPQLSLLGAGIFVCVLTTWLVYLLSSALTIVLAANMISGEVEAGTFAVIVPKPLSRAEIVLGKWLGYLLTLGSYTALLFLAFLFVIYLETGYWPEQALTALGILELEILVLLGIMTLGSAFVPTLVNGAIALILFICAPMSSLVRFVIQIITPAQSQAMQNIATAINLIIPTDALWHGASFYLLPSTTLFTILDLSPNSFNTPFTAIEPVATAFLIWAAFYSFVLPLIAVLRFQRRDL